MFFLNHSIVLRAFFCSKVVDIDFESSYLDTLGCYRYFCYNSKTFVFVFDSGGTTLIKNRGI